MVNSEIETICRHASSIEHVRMFGLLDKVGEDCNVFRGIVGWDNEFDMS